MTLKPGTVQSFSANSLAEAIESAFAAELRATKNQPLRPIAVDDRRLLFAAIAQGVLAFLARNDSDLKVDLDTGGGSDLRSVQVRAPTLSVSGGTVTGTGWQADATITLTWVGSGAAAGTTTASSSGSFSIAAVAPPGGDVLGARDSSGNAAAVRL